MENSEAQTDFGPEVLLIFVGHSDDTKKEAEAIRSVETKLQRELESLLKVIPDSTSFRLIRIWDWNYDAALGVGGQAKSITPYLERANIALFVFKERIGTITWEELLECRRRSEYRIPVIAIFPETPPSSVRFNDLQAVSNWLDLLQKKRELTIDWTLPSSTSLTPIEDYRDGDHLLEIVFNRIRSIIPNLLKTKTETRLPVSVRGTESKFLGAYTEFSFDRRQVIGYSVDHLDRRLLRDFLSKPLSQDEARAAGMTSPTPLEHLGILGLLQDGQLTLGTFLCFAPKALVANKFDACSLQCVSYDGVTKGASKAQITKVRDNLLNLFEEGMGWLSFRSGLRRLGTVGTTERDELEIPRVALREALANALVHRNYEDPEHRDQPTRIEVFEDRVEITSYGRLPNTVSIDQLNNDPETLAPVRRNPAIALIFNHMTHVELNASGISRMRLETQKALLPAPKIYAERDFVRVIFMRRSLGAIESLVQQDTTNFPRTASRSPKSVFISSTARDLPEHRKEIMDACLRQGMFPVMMEHLPASDTEAIALSLQMVDKADIYIGVLAHRYGDVPQGQDISFTEMEYNRAMDRKIPRLLFVIGKDHPVGAGDVEIENLEKLKAFKDRVAKENIVNFFNSPADLRNHAINSLSKLRVPDLTMFHYVSDIPTPPECFIAHPYTLLQTHGLLGRRAELKLLTDWVSKPKSKIYRARILNVVAIGGMGKSALTWQWFNEIAPQEMQPLAGRMWWSFHESDATFENLITRALAYVTRRPLAEVQQLAANEREAQLLSALDREPFLVVLDGLERALVAYARIDAAHLSDEDYDRRTANWVAAESADGLLAGVAELRPAVDGRFTEEGRGTQELPGTGEHRLRKTSDPRAGAFLRKLTTVRAARVLVSTRLYPADLQTMTGEPLGACSALFLGGLKEHDALNLWRSFGATGARAQVLSVFKSVENHPLLIQSLAAEVARFRRAPGDFDRWREAHPDFDPFRDLPLVKLKSHMLEFALRGVEERARQVLQIIAAFRMPAGYDTLTQLLVGESKPCRDERELDAVLAELEDRGLVGWDKRANRYDLHPIVRGVVWSGLGQEAQRRVYNSLHAHFDALPMINDYLKVSRLEDLTPTIELYNTLIGLERYEDAYIVFRDRLSKATLYRLSASRQQAELLEMLFADGLDQLPRLHDSGDQASVLNSLALAYDISGQPGRAAPLFRRQIPIHSEMNRDDNLGISLCNLSNTLRLSGALCEAEAAARRATVITRASEHGFGEAVSLYWLGLSLAARGVAHESASALQRSSRMFVIQSNSQSEGVVNSYLAQRALWFGAFVDAYAFANRASELANVLNVEGDLIRAARLQGTAALGLHDLALADEQLHHSVTRARQVNLVEEELPALIALAELRRQQGKPEEARELLDDVWDASERGPYPCSHADALNVLAQLERDSGSSNKAFAAASEAYRLAWCDGPPFAYHWGLVAAKEHLRELGMPEPKMNPFDESRFEPMLEVEINPEDEFHAEINTRDD